MPGLRAKTLSTPLKISVPQENSFGGRRIGGRVHLQLGDRAHAGKYGLHFIAEASISWDLESRGEQQPF